jgi:hypothetical protein
VHSENEISRSHPVSAFHLKGGTMFTFVIIALYMNLVALAIAKQNNSQPLDLR